MQQSTKLVGGIAYIAMVVFSVLSILVPMLSIFTLIAAICVLVAYIQAGNQLRKPDIKQNAVIAVVVYIVAAVLMVFLVSASVGAMMAGGASSWNVGTILGGIIGWVLSIFATWYWYKASRSLAEGTGENLFKVGGLLVFVGAIFLVIGIGAIAIWVGEILQAIAFFTVSDQARAAEPPAAA